MTSDLQNLVPQRSKRIGTRVFPHDARRFSLLVERLLQKTELEEEDLSYRTACRSEYARRSSGSYYTPVDVAGFFWDQHFHALGIKGVNTAKNLLKKHTFVEPSAGSGILILALFRKLAEIGVGPDVISSIDLRCRDTDPHSLAYISTHVNELETATGLSFGGIKLEQGDFRGFLALPDDKPYIFFGNPPFVSNLNGSSPWKNLFADFLDVSMGLVGTSGSIQYILPLAISFSRDYVDLRRRLRSESYDLFASHFDNIPDTLFKSGKPNNSNSNKANSQRCTILTVISRGSGKLFSSMLHRWSVSDRRRLLSSIPTFYDVSDYHANAQILRPGSRNIAHYLMTETPINRFSSLVAQDGKYRLYVAGVARNYIGIRSSPGSGIHTLSFSDEQKLCKALLLLGSDVFLEYWRAVGDGFHVTKSNIHDFPISEKLDEEAEKLVPIVKRIWKDRERFKKVKRNSGKQTSSFDFSSALPSLLPLIHYRRDQRTRGVVDESEGATDWRDR